jgi:TM2 domain-containing membrane protein YozV
MNCAHHPDVPVSAYCQFCGKPLCKDCVRSIGGVIYCEQCLAARVQPGGVPVSAPVGTIPLPPANANPLLAALLGFIPGVGAMYNGQFVKGIAHVIIFAVLTSLSHSSDIFGILVAAWVFYQVFDAYQTARARQLGLPLPNPFGLNDLGQKLGLQPLVGSAPSASPYASGGPYTGSAYPPPGNPPPTAGNPSADPGAPAAGFAPSSGAAYGYTEAPFGATPPYTPTPGTGAPGTQAGGQAYYTDPAYTGMGYTGTGYTGYDPRAARRSGSDRPTGAIILIGLGTLFLFESLGILHGVWLGRAWPLLIIGLGIWLFIRRSRSLPPAGVPPAGPMPGPVQGPGNGGSQ